MLIALAMPQFGESSSQALIVRWLKKEGDSTKEAEPIVEMETEKAVFSYESPFRGKLTKILQGDGVQVAVGTEIAHFEVTGEDGKKYLSLGVGRLIGGGTTPQISVPQKAPQAPVPQKAPSGPGREGVKTIRLTPVRTRIAEKMTLSKQTIPHAGCRVEVDLTVVEKQRAKQKAGYLPFAIIAALKALKKFPILNSSWKEAKEAEGRRWIEQYDFVHVGIAVATDQGLLVPVIRNAQKLSFEDLSREVERLVEAGRQGRLKVEELTGATFSVNNAGAIGAVASQQIIPHPQAAILAINRVVRRPWAVGEKVEIRPIMGLDLAFDHRIIDGDQAVGFLAEVGRQLENFNLKEVN